MVTRGAGETSWLYVSAQTSMRWWHLNLDLKDEKDDLEKEHSRQREEQTHAPEQSRVWGLWNRMVASVPGSLGRGMRLERQAQAL